MNASIALLLPVLLLSACVTTPPEKQVGSGATPGGHSGPDRKHSGVVVSHPSSFDSHPRLVSYRPPDYPRSLWKRGVTGRVTVQFTVEADGSVSHPQVLGSPPPELAAIALQTIGQWKYKPALKNGSPVPVLTEQEFAFGLN